MNADPNIEVVLSASSQDEILDKSADVDIDILQVDIDDEKDKGIQYIDAIKNDKAFSSKLTDKEIDSIFSPEKHLGASPIIISNVRKSVEKTVKKFI